jgi:excisionase family DNA binding protein
MARDYLTDSQTTPPVLLRGPEVADVLSISKSTAHLMIASGELPHIRMGRSVRVPYKSLMEYIERNTEGTTDGAR